MGTVPKKNQSILTTKSMDLSMLKLIEFVERTYFQKRLTMEMNFVDFIKVLK